MSSVHLSDSLFDAVCEGNVDTVTDLLKRGANVNIISASGRTALGKAAQLNRVAIVNVLLDADTFYSTPEEEVEEIDGELYYLATSPCSEQLTDLASFGNSSQFLVTPKETVKHTHKCCSPSIDSETFTCNDEVWGQDASDSNTGQQSDLESLPSCRVQSKTNHSLPDKKYLSQAELPLPIEKDKSIKDDENKSQEQSAGGKDNHESSMQNMVLSPYSISNIGYYVYEYREKQEETEDSSGPVVSSTEDSDSASTVSEVKFLIPPCHRQSSSVLLHRSLGRGRTNIASSDSEFETENLHRRRHARHSHHRPHHRASEAHHARPKCLSSSPRSSNPYFSQLHSNYLSLGISSPWLLNRCCDINQLDMYGRSALHYATEQGHTYIVQILIKAGAKVDSIDADHMTPLHLATQRGFTEVVNLLLDAGAKVNNKMNDKSSPLHIAASRGYTDLVESLLERGAKIDSVDSSDRTPLFLSVSRAHYRGAQILIKRGAKVNIEEIHGYTPLCEAVWQKDVRLVQLLLHAKAKVTQSHYLLHYAVLHRQYQLVELLLDARCIVNLRDDKGDTPLLIAARTCQPNIIKLLLCHGANTNYPNGVTGARPLHEAVEATRDADFEQFPHVLRLLKTYGAKLDMESITNGDTPLYRAIMLSKNKAAAMLIRKGCDVNMPIPPGSCSDYLQMALVRNHLQLSLLIILAGFKIHSITWIKETIVPGSLMERINKIRCNPLSLRDQCRIHIRRKLGLGICRRSLLQFNLPPGMIKFLKLENMNEFDDI